MKAVKDLLTRAKNESLLFDICGYQDSNGRLHDYLGLRHAGHAGYLLLVQEAVDWAEKRKAYIPGWCNSPETWIAAVVQQRESWLTTLAGGHGRKAQELDYDTSGAWAENKSKPGILVLKALEVTGEHKHVDEPVIAEPKTMAAKCTAFLRSQSPLKRFVGQLNLAPGKFASIQLREQHTHADS